MALLLLPLVVIGGASIGALGGAFSGWVASWLCPIWMTSGLALLGLHVSVDQLVPLGTAVGFIGGLFRSHTSCRKD